MYVPWTNLRRRIVYIVGRYSNTNISWLDFIITRLDITANNQRTSWVKFKVLPRDALFKSSWSANFTRILFSPLRFYSFCHFFLNYPHLSVHKCHICTFHVLRSWRKDGTVSICYGYYVTRHISPWYSQLYPCFGHVTEVDSGKKKR